MQVMTDNEFVAAAAPFRGIRAHDMEQCSCCSLSTFRDPYHLSQHRTSVSMVQGNNMWPEADKQPKPDHSTKRIKRQFMEGSYVKATIGHVVHLFQLTANDDGRDQLRVAR